MRKYIPAAFLVLIILGLFGAAGYLYTQHDSLKPVSKTKAYDVKHCATLETSGVTICTTTKLVKKAAISYAGCVEKNKADDCSSALVTEVQNACTQQGGKANPCARDTIRLVAVIEGQLTGDSVKKTLKTVGVSQR